MEASPRSSDKRTRVSHTPSTDSLASARRTLEYPSVLPSTPLSMASSACVRSAYALSSFFLRSANNLARTSGASCALKAYSAQEAPEVRAKLLAERRKKLESAYAERTQALEAMDKGVRGRTEGYSSEIGRA